MAKHAAKATNRDQPTSGVTIAPQGSGISPDNPFGDLIPQKPSAGLFDDLIPASGQAELRFAPTSGVTIAPKNALRVRLQPRNRGRLVQAPLGPMSPGRLRTSSPERSALRFRLAECRPASKGKVKITAHPCKAGHAAPAEEI
jgi:hypothetical protein